MFPWLDDDDDSDKARRRAQSLLIATREAQIELLVKEGIAGFDRLSLGEKATFMNKSLMNTESCKNIPEDVRQHVIRERRLAKLMVKHNCRKSDYLYMTLAEKREFVLKEGFEGIKKKLDLYERAWFLDDAGGIYNDVNQHLKHLLLYDARICKIAVGNPIARRDFIMMSRKEKIDFIKSEGVVGFTRKLTDFEQSVFLNGIGNTVNIPEYDRLSALASKAKQRFNESCEYMRNNPSKGCILNEKIEDTPNKIKTSMRKLKGI